MSAKHDCFASSANTLRNCTTRSRVAGRKVFKTRSFLQNSNRALEARIQSILGRSLGRSLFSRKGDRMARHGKGKKRVVSGYVAKLDVIVGKT